jgi:DNA-binding Xre family transcriptional regulator
MDQARTIGDRVRDVRRRRGLSRRELSALSGLSLSLVRKLGQGERQDIRIETARKLAVSLDVPTMALIGDTSAPPPVTSCSAWEPVRLALADPVSGADLEPVTEDGLSEALTAAVKLYHDNQYDSLALVLPGLLRDARDASPLLRSRVLQLTGSLMVQTRQRDLARIALDRSLADAEESGSVLDAASSPTTGTGTCST